MTRRKPPEPPPVIREGRSPGNGEPTVARACEEPRSAVKTWRRISAPRNALLNVFGDGISSQLMVSLDDRAFLVAMRNRLLSMRPPTLNDWAWLRRLMRVGGNRTRMVAYEVKRLLQIAGDDPPGELHDRDYLTVTYDQLRRLIEAAEAGLPSPTEPSA